MKTEIEIRAEFTKFNNETAWVSGVVNEYRFEAKLFDIGSVLGINDGRVSKLGIWHEGDRRECCNYDRGWDIEPNEYIKPYYDAVMSLLESSPKRFSE